MSPGRSKDYRNDKVDEEEDHDVKSNRDNQL